MPWHDRIQDDLEAEGWGLTVRFYDRTGTLEVGQRRYDPAGKDHENEWESYSGLTSAEAQDVVCAHLDGLRFHQQSLF